jgi:thiamine-phosphate pyrophosphorylase
VIRDLENLVVSAKVRSIGLVVGGVLWRRIDGPMCPADWRVPMMVVITAPSQIPGESDTIRRVFEEGLEFLHVRRPGATSSELTQLLETIPTTFHSRVVLHSHYGLQKVFPKLAHVHFTERFAKKCRREPKIPYSLSIHAATRNGPLVPGALYTLFGPVFPSFSKPGYNPQLSSEELKDWCKNSPAPVIGVGGICCERVVEAKSLGLSGIALHSEIWSKEPVARIAAFRAVREIWRSRHEA